MIFGKTNTPELGISPSTVPAIFGATATHGISNERQADRAAAPQLQSRLELFPLAHGSDSGGSIRIPASCCGLFRAQTHAGSEGPWDPTAANKVAAWALRTPSQDRCGTAQLFSTRQLDPIWAHLTELRRRCDRGVKKIGARPNRLRIAL